MKQFLDFVDFKISQSGESLSSVLLNIIMTLMLRKHVHSVRTNSSVHNVEEVELLCMRMFKILFTEMYSSFGHIHVKFFAHIHYLVRNEFMRIIRSKETKMQKAN